jgi:excisionase family DNA binding protein
MSAKEEELSTQHAKRILSLTEACDFIGVKAPTMYNYLKNGTVPAFKMEGSRVWKFDRLKLEEWLEQQQRRGANGY